MFTNEICPYKSHADHRNKFCDAVHITHMGVLDIETGRFHGSKGRFYLPSFFVCQNRLLGPIEAYENLQFRNTIGVFDSTAGKIDILTFVKKELREELLLADLQIIEQPPRLDSLTGGRLDNPEVLTYPDVIPNTTAVKPSSPFLSDEPSVSDQTIDTVLSEKSDETFHNLLPFFPVGIATFREKTEYQREGNPFIGDAQHENVDIELSELPVGAIHVPNVDLYAVADNGVYAGFISLSPVAIEMLFIDSDCRGMGLWGCPHRICKTAWGDKSRCKRTESFSFEFLQSKRIPFNIKR